MKRSLLQDAFGHHIWATVRLIDACLPLTAEQLATPVPGTYGSIIETMRHLVGADASYLSLLDGGRTAQIGDEQEATMDLASLRPVIEANGPGWSAVLGTDLDPDRIVIRVRDDGSTSSAPLGIRLAQVLHHGTDHRSQVCTALTNLGIEPPGIDVWEYALNDGRLDSTPPTS
jgi:uncharacterized damage-inducible protein DinB